MSVEKETSKNLGYIGESYQIKLFHLLLTDQAFGVKYFDYFETSYFTKIQYKKLFTIIKSFFEKYSYLPSIKQVFGSSNILEAINSSSLSDKDKDELITLVKTLYVYNHKLRIGEYPNDYEYVVDTIKKFFKQQEYIRLGSAIFDSVNNGTFENKDSEGKLLEIQNKIEKIDLEEDQGEDVFDNIGAVLSTDYRNPIPTGDPNLDKIMNGGLGEGEMAFILAPLGTGKAQPLYSKILTPDGWVKMGDIKLGDKVISSNGNETTVLGIYPQVGKREVYTVYFNDGTKTECDIDHIWSVNTLNMRNGSTHKKGTRIKVKNESYKQMTLREILNEGIYKRNQLNFRIPLVKPINFTKREVDIHPYLYGCLLGDGYFNRASITTSDEEIIDKLRTLNINFKLYDRTRKEEYKKLYEISLISFKEKLKKYHDLNLVSDTKFIHEDFLFNSIENRVSLLQGLMDTDGYIDKKGIISFSTASIQLAENVRDLVRSLGGFSNIKHKKTSYRDGNGKMVECKISHIVSISLCSDDIKPFSLTRKLERFKPRKKYSKSKFISKIEFKEYTETQCIYVDDESHEYITDDFIVTHNTTLLSIFANHAYKMGKNVLYLFFEDKYKEIKRKHYAIWSDLPQSQFKEENFDIIRERVTSTQSSKENGILKIKKLKSEGVTMRDIKKYIIEYQKRNNIKFDIIFLDYLDCVESHIQHKNELKEELYVIKAFEGMLDELKIPGWSAIQGNRDSIASEIVNTNQMGGSIKKAQKTHFLMSINKTFEQKLVNKANVAILKSRLGKDGIVCKDSILDNDAVKFSLNLSDVNETELKDFLSDSGLSSSDVNQIKDLL